MVGTNPCVTSALICVRAYEDHTVDMRTYAYAQTDKPITAVAALKNFISLLANEFDIILTHTPQKKKSHDWLCLRMLESDTAQTSWRVSRTSWQPRRWPPVSIPAGSARKPSVSPGLSRDLPSRRPSAPPCRQAPRSPPDSPESWLRGLT